MKGHRRCLVRIVVRVAAARAGDLRGVEAGEAAVRPALRLKLVLGPHGAQHGLTVVSSPRMVQARVLVVWLGHGACRSRGVATLRKRYGPERGPRPVHPGLAPRMRLCVAITMAFPPPWLFYDGRRALAAGSFCSGIERPQKLLGARALLCPRSLAATKGHAFANNCVGNLARIWGKDDQLVSGPHLCT